QADDQADCKPLLEKAVKAMGGEAKLAKLQFGSWKAKITGQENGREIVLTQEGTWKDGDKYKMDVEAQFGGQTKKALLVLNGESGWAEDGDKTEDAPKEIVAFIRNVIYTLRMPTMVTALADKEFKLSPLGEVKVGESDAAGLRISHKNFKDASFFFNKK